MFVKHAIMALLTRRPMYGYELLAEFERMVYGQWPLNAGQIYSTIDRLARDGLISVERIRQDDRPDKNVCTLTPKGRDHLAEWLRRPERGQDSFLRRDFFFKLLLCLNAAGAGTAMQLISAYRSGYYTRMRELGALSARLDPRKDGLMHLLAEGAMLDLEAQMKWLDICEQRLLSLGGTDGT